MLARLMTTAVLFFAAGTAFAEGTQFNMLDKDQFVAYDAQVRNDFGMGTRYKEIAPEKQAAVLDTLTRMEQRWDKAGPGGKLNPNDVVDMANDQEVVVTILTHAAADSRVVCSRESPMGTKIAVTVCRTIAQMKREQNEGQDGLRDAQAKTRVSMKGN